MILKKRVENCDNCGVENQPDPEQACEDCIAAAEREGRVFWGALNPETSQILEIRGRFKAGYPYQKDDLKIWQWELLSRIENMIEEVKAEEIKKHGSEHSKIRR